jgi:recombination protein RecR
VYSPAVERLITELSKLPGIGPRTAQRLAFYMLKVKPGEILPLAAAIVEVKEKIGFCKRCFNLAEGDLCTICSDTRRDAALLCVVEQPADIIPIERTREYHGLYHVLGGTLSPLEGRGPQDLTLDALVDRVKKNPKLKEIVVATDPTVEGDSTALYLQQLLKVSGIKVTRLARGLPSGGDVDYTDEMTLLKAFENRREF